MPLNQETIRLSDDIPVEQRPEFLRALYSMLLKDVGGIGLRKVWPAGEDDYSLIFQVDKIFKKHALHWGEINHGHPTWSVANAGQVDGAAIEAGEAVDVGWLRLAKDVEQKEFEVFATIWAMAETSVNEGASSWDFFKKAAEIASQSNLFQIIKSLEVDRPNGKKKKIFPHISEVTAGIDQFEDLIPLRKSGNLSATQRRAEQRFVAVMHDIVNSLLADNDWLQLHAHAAATFLYRFFVVRMKFMHEEAVRVVNVIGFHHLPEVTEIRHQTPETDKVLEVHATNRVIDPQEAFEYYRQRPGGWEELGRLIRFCLVDVGSNEVFKAEHIAAFLGIIELIILNLDQNKDENMDVEAVQVLVDMQILAVAYLGLLDQAQVPEPSRDKYAHIVNIVSARADRIGALLDKLSENQLVSSIFIRALSYS